MKYDKGKEKAISWMPNEEKYFKRRASRDMRPYVHKKRKFIVALFIYPQNENNPNVQI